MRRCAPLVCATLLATLSAPLAAHADVFGPIELGSDGVLAGEAQGDGLQQALYAHDPAVSGNGRYVAFDGYFDGRTGVWRRELQPPYTLQPVAVGAVHPGSEACVGGSACDAELPSVSQNGQYVSFTTTAQLDPSNDTGSGPDVYVRNMNVPESQPCEEEEALHPAQPCAFTLASAVNGSTQGLAYAGEGAGGYGAVAVGRSALSANGQEVAFVTTAESDLAGPNTPALQVAVRNLASGETELVSAEYDRATGTAIPGQPVSRSEDGTSFGAAYSPQTTPPAFPFNNRAYSLPPAVGASISADGSTVAWMGRVVDKQAPMLAGESVSPYYAEPLWRRIADGPLTPTRRVTGGSQPESAACLASGELSLPITPSAADPCQGPFAVEGRYGVWAGTVGDSVPQLSADGYTVAFVASAQLVALGVDFGRSSEGEADDLYVANMHEGLTRSEALRPLTELASGHESDPASNAPVVNVAVSPDGSQVAFSTERTEFPLGTPAYVSQPASVAGMAELYDADLADETLTRVTQSFTGGASERPHETANAGEGDPYRRRTDGALSPSFSDDGDILAFSSTASNLVYGEGNTPSQEAGTGSADGSNVFVVARKQFAPTATETYVSTPPPGPSLTPAWRLGVTAYSLANGQVRMYIEVPSAGTLSVTADSAMAARLASPARSAAARARAGRATRARSKARSSKRAVATVAVAAAKKVIEAGVGGFTELTLTLAPPYRALASRPGGLAGMASVVFTAHARGALKDQIPISFKRRSTSTHVKTGARARGSAIRGAPSGKAVRR